MKIKTNKIVASILTCSCVLAFTALPAGAISQNKPQLKEYTYNTVDNNGICKIDVTKNEALDTATSISDSDEQHIEVVREGDDYTITILQKDANGNLIPESKSVQTITLDRTSDSITAKDSTSENKTIITSSKNA